MKTPGVIALMFAVVCGAASAAEAPAPAAKWVAAETTQFVWRKGAAPYTFIVEGDSVDGVGPGGENAPRLRILPPRGVPLIATMPDGFASTSDTYPLHPSFTANLIHSRYLYMTPRLTNTHGEPALIVFGTPMMSDAGMMRIFMLNDDGGVRIVHSEDTFDLAEIADLDGDGMPELAGYRWLSQTFNDCVKTYDPATVLRFASPRRERFVEDLALDRRYTEAHGIEWAGPSAREDVGVSLCGANKGRIVKPPAVP